MLFEQQAWCGSPIREQRLLNFIQHFQRCASYLRAVTNRVNTVNAIIASISVGKLANEQFLLFFVHALRNDLRHTSDCESCILILLTFYNNYRQQFGKLQSIHQPTSMDTASPLHLWKVAIGGIKKLLQKPPQALGSKNLYVSQWWLLVKMPRFLDMTFFPCKWTILANNKFHVYTVFFRCSD